MAAPAQAPAQAPASSGPIDNNDIEYWTHQANKTLADVGGTINSQSPPNAAPWSSGFFSCFNPIDTCLVGWCLPCVSFGKTHHRIAKNGNLDGYEPVNTSCLLFCATSWIACHWIPVALQRQIIREKYNLEGSCLFDIATACCCHCCSIIQQDKETAYREGLLQNQNKQQYQGQPGMTYP